MPNRETVLTGCSGFEPPEPRKSGAQLLKGRPYDYNPAEPDERFLGAFKSRAVTTKVSLWKHFGGDGGCQLDFPSGWGRLPRTM